MRRAGARAMPPPTIRWCASARRPRSAFDPAEIHHGEQSDAAPPILLAALPLVVVVAVNLLMSLVVLPRMDTAFLAEARWGATSLSAVGGVWSVVVALAAAIVVLVCSSMVGACRRCAPAWMPAPTPPCCRSQRREPGRLRRRGRGAAGLRDRCATGCSASSGGPLVSLAVATNVLSALTGSASGGLTIALDALGADLHAARRRARHRPGADAPRGGDRRRHARQPAAQRRRGDPARGLRLDASARAISTSSWSASSAPCWRWWP